MAVIEVHNLEKSYRHGFFGRTVHALKGVSLQVEPGEIFGLLGPNGAGKTTLIKVLLGIVKKTKGTATVLGELAGSRRSRVKVGYLPENHRIPRHLTGYTALEFYGALSGMSLRDIYARRDALLETVGLELWGGDRVSSYSKGMLQRLGLAQAMLHDPDLIILDEPTDGVDPVGRQEIRVVLRKLKDEGKTIFLNSHLLQEVEQVCDRVAILDLGEVKRIAGVQELISQGTEYEFTVAGPSDEIRAALTGRQLEEWQELAPALFKFMLKLATPQETDAVIDKLRAARIGIRSMTHRKNSLEDVFIRIVQEADSERSQRKARKS